MSTERINVPDVLAKPRDHAIICKGRHQIVSFSFEETVILSS